MFDHNGTPNNLGVVVEVVVGGSVVVVVPPPVPVFPPDGKVQAAETQSWGCAAMTMSTLGSAVDDHT
jgi:hypothetical protein